MKLNNNHAYIIVMFLFALTVIYRNDVEKGKVDLSLYHIDVNNTKAYFLQEEYILVGTKNSNILTKINFYNSPNSKLYSEEEQIILKKKVNQNLISTSKYIIKNDIKLYLIHKSFYKTALNKEQK